MTSSNLLKFCLLTVLFSLTPKHADAQIFKEIVKKVKNAAEKVVVDASTKDKTNTTKNTTDRKNNSTEEFSQKLSDDVKFIEPPNQIFRPVAYQTHNGLTRVGNNDFHRNPVNNGYTDTSKLLGDGLNLYKTLLQLRFLSEYFDLLDPYEEFKLERSRSYDEQTLKKNVAQHLLNHSALLLMTDEGKDYFFTNPENSKSKVVQARWGGINSNEFRKRKLYNEFFTNYKKYLQEYGNKIFENGSEEVYFVIARSPFSGYDFTNKGYWIKLGIDSKHNRVSHLEDRYGFFKNFNPQTEYGKAYQNKRKQLNPGNYSQKEPGVFFKINENEAESLSNDQNVKQIFYTIKIKVTFDKIFDLNSNTPTLVFSYSLLSPKINFYKNKELTEKIGEVDLQNIKFQSIN